MNDQNPIDLLFGGMEKLGPGSNADTLQVLRLLPRKEFDIIVDSGCGTGRQTLALARELGSTIHAIDNYEPFLIELKRRAADAHLDHLIQSHLMDMKDIPTVFPQIDLLWSEGAAYNIGFANALTTWSTVLNKHGFLVISELSWLRDQVPASVREFFASGYPEMRSVEENIALTQSSGLKLLTTHTLPPSAWTEGYYDILEPRAKKLLSHPNPSVRDFASETSKEIEIFKQSENSFGYVFFVLVRA